MCRKYLSLRPRGSRCFDPRMADPRAIAAVNKSGTTSAIVNPADTEPGAVAAAAHPAAVVTDNAVVTDAGAGADHGADGKLMLGSAEDEHKAAAGSSAANGGGAAARSCGGGSRTAPGPRRKRKVRCITFLHDLATIDETALSYVTAVDARSNIERGGSREGRAGANRAQAAA